MNFENQDVSGYEVTSSSSVVARMMTKVYLWMAIGLGITALTAFLVLSWGEKNPDMFISLMSGKGFWVLAIAEIALVFFLSARALKLDFRIGTFLFGLYAVLNGVTLTPIFLIYTQSSIVSTFVICAGMFGAMALIGSITKKDLSSFGRILFMALIGLIIASIVNIFLGSSTMDWVISIIGVILFSGLTIYDVNKFRQIFSNEELSYTDTGNKVAILGALSLYLDFINLFLFLLRLFGASRD